jgi:hypothetical protein
VSSLDGKGTVNFYNYDFNTEMPAEIVAIEGKAGRSDEDKKTLDAHYTSDVKLLAGAALETGLFAISFRPDGASVAVAGEDGKVRFVNAADAKVVKEFIPVPLTAAQAATPTAQTGAK